MPLHVKMSRDLGYSEVPYYGGEISEFHSIYISVQIVYVIPSCSLWLFTGVIPDTPMKQKEYKFEVFGTSGVPGGSLPSERWT